MNKKMYKGHFARKRFGQNFLIDQVIINDIITAFNLKSNQVIIEIGPGLGALTIPIYNIVNDITVIELDYDLVSRLINHNTSMTKLKIIQNDALMVDFASIAKRKGQSVRVLGNLPYNISIPLILYLFSFINYIVDMNFMLQKEVVNRLIAKPNTKDYSRLTVLAQYYCQINPILNISPSAFIPQPKVDSVVVHLIPYQSNPYYFCDIKLLNYVTTKAFNQRRKMISNSLSDLFNTQDFKQLDIDLNYRAENISVENYCKLANRLSFKIKNSNKKFEITY